MKPANKGAARMRVHVDWIFLDRFAESGLASAAMLSSTEQRRADGFRQQRDRCRFVARRCWVRLKLADALGCQPETVSFDTEAFGRPILPGGRPSFSLSHSAGLAVLALTEQGAVGCDVERIDPAIDVMQAAAAVFSPGEHNALRALPSSLQPEAFARTWTRKEAYIKALGVGFTAGLEKTDVTPPPGQPHRLSVDCHGWAAVSFMPEPNFCASVAAFGASAVFFDRNGAEID